MVLLPGLRRKLPSITSLLAFEAAARHASLSKASTELNVTQPAISRQLKLLEQDLGTRLYTRRSHGIELTTKGRELFSAVSLGFNHVLLAAEQIRGRPRHGVTIHANVGFATFWLMPKLNLFSARFPAVSTALMAHDTDPDLLDENIDLAVCFGDGEWSGSEAVPFLNGEVFPVCSQGFCDAHPVRSMRDLGHVPLLEFSGIDLRWMPWPAWFNALGLEAPEAPPRAQFNNYPLLIGAALDGQGLALGWRHLLDEHLRRGDLVRPLGESLRTRDSFWLVRSKSRRPSPDADLLWQWLIDARSPTA